MSEVASPRGEERARRLPRGAEWAVVSIATAAALVLVWQRAWVSDDALITLRYVRNTLEGLGPVYNPGERVQGYTHPLWFLLLVMGGRVVDNLYLVPIVLGLLLTASTVVVLTRAVLCLTEDPLWASFLIVSGLAVIASSDAWASFQTGGLENSLTHFLLVAWIVEALGRDGLGRRPGYVVLLASLVCLSRPDQLFLVAPLTLLIVVRSMSTASTGRVLLATLPAACWIAFSWGYYGTPVPNTAIAKLGIYPTRAVALDQGFNYLRDWIYFESLAFVGTIVGISAILRWGRTRGSALALGLGSQLAWVVWIGGDFMRGRFFLSVLTGALAGCLVILARWGPRPRSKKQWALSVAAGSMVLVAGFLLKPLPPSGINRVGVADEWRIYPGYHLASVVRTGRLEAIRNRSDLADVILSYTASCGPIAMHATNAAYIGYVVGSDLRLIDALGLTSAYVAHLPRELLLYRRPRPGHPYKLIPREYLVSQGDIRLVPGWEEALVAHDCSLGERARQMNVEGYVTPRPIFWLR